MRRYFKYTQFSLIYILLFGTILYANSYKKECEKIYSNPLTRAMLKKAPVILSPKNNYLLTPSPESLGVSQYLYTHLPIDVCVYPKKKTLQIKIIDITLANGKKVSYPNSVYPIDNKVYLRCNLGVIVNSYYKIKARYLDSNNWSKVVSFRVKDSIAAILSPKNGSWQIGDVAVKVGLSGYHERVGNSYLTLQYFWAPPPTPSSNPNIPSTNYLPKEIFKSTVKIPPKQDIYKVLVPKSKLTNGGKRVGGEYSIKTTFKLSDGKIKSDYVRFKIGNIKSSKNMKLKDIKFK